MRNNKVSEQDIIAFIGQQGKEFREIAKFLKEKDLKVVNNTLRQLQQNGLIFYKKSTDSFHIKNQEEKTGTFFETRYDYSFIEVDNERYFVPAKFKLNALHGDSVKFRIVETTEKGSVARVFRVVQRNGNNLVGQIVKDKLNPTKLTFAPDEFIKEHDYLLTNPEDVVEGQIVVCKFVDYINNVIHVKVQEVLANNRANNIDWIIVAKKFNLELDFDQEIKQEAERVKSLNHIDGRVDRRNHLIVTIDGEKSKDLDDAIEVSKLANGNFLLGVHIADVSHFVENNQPLDLEARRRATSTYLIDKVIPMLPKTLSDDLCSLNPHTDKLCLSVDMEIDHKGNVVKRNYYKSVINSKHRLTYTEVDKLYAGTDTWIKEDKALSEMLTNALELSKVLRLKKVGQGMIDFQLTETLVELDADGAPIRIYEKKQTLSEKVIEDLMVVTNEMVATFFQDRGMQALFRVHGQPKIENLEEFIVIARTLGHPVGVSAEKITNQVLMDYLQKIPHDLVLSGLLKKFLIQTMEKAKYTPDNGGHYALGLENYLHFTSPIRRYPDLIVHRLLKTVLANESVEKLNLDLESIGLVASEKERNSMLTEKKLQDIKKAKFIKDKLNEEFDGKIVSVHKFGLFVEFMQGIQGFIRSTEIGQDTYNFDEHNLRLVGQTKRAIFTLGDTIKVKVVNIDDIKGNIDLSVNENNYIKQKD